MTMIRCWGVLSLMALLGTARADEPLLPGNLIEGVNANTVLVSCNGRGADLEMATHRGRQGCVDWYARTHLIHAQDELARYDVRREDILAKINQFIGIPTPASASGRGVGLKSRTRINADEVRVVFIVKLHKKRLQDALVGLGIIAPASAIPMQRLTVALSPSREVPKGTWDRTVRSAIASRMTANGWNVVDVGKGKQLDRVMRALKGTIATQDDSAVLHALAAGADLSVVYGVRVMKGESEIASVAASANIFVTEAATGRAIATQAARSAARAAWNAGAADVAVKEAVEDTLARLEPQLLRYRKGLARGKRAMYLAFVQAPKEAEPALTAIIRESCREVQMARTEGRNLFYKARCGPGGGLGDAIGRRIEQRFGKGAFTWLARSPVLLLIEFQ